jgi:hypothetical protein
MKSPEALEIPQEMIDRRLAELIAAADLGLAVLRGVHSVDDLRPPTTDGDPASVVAEAEAILRSPDEDSSRV